MDFREWALIFFTILAQLSVGAFLVLGVDALGPDGQLPGRWPQRMLWSRCASIAGGTNEIQRNIIAQRLLGLPRS